MVNLGILEAISVGKKKVQVSHLQYADIILACPGKIENVKVIKHILHLFEVDLGAQGKF